MCLLFFRHTLMWGKYLFGEIVETRNINVDRKILCRHTVYSKTFNGLDTRVVLMFL